MSKSAVLDASALLAYVNQESGWEEVEPYLDGAAMSSVNFCESLTVLARQKRIPLEQLFAFFTSTGLHIIPFDESHAKIAAALYQHVHGHKFGISLGDRACLALGASLGAVVVTADKNWKKLDINLRFVFIR